MPPKKSSGDSKKTEAKKKEKIIEDKTFGLKNKKGAKQQKFVEHVTHQVKYGNQSARKMEQTQRDKDGKKDEKKRQIDEINKLFKPVVDSQKIGKGVDPKSVLCAFFKQGQCGKGAKCKFSHDLSQERKSEKRNVYEDSQKDADNMANWDEKKLEDVVNKKHGEENKTKTKTDIICKFFLEAVESSKYGWFWECPNGIKCHYKHALPPGFVLKRDAKKMEEQKEETISLEELIETERAALGGDLTKITLESFMAWKQKKRKEKIARDSANKTKRHDDFKAGRMLGISGREMFEFNPDLITEEDDDDGEVLLMKGRLEIDDEDSNITDIATDSFTLDSLSQAVKDAHQHPQITQLNGEHVPSQAGNASVVSSQQLEANRDNSQQELLGAVGGAEIDGVPIDEDLFADEIDDLDIDDAEQLDDLDITQANGGNDR